MKLYTEEQVKEAIQKTSKFFCYIHEKEKTEILDSLISIQLPSDEEINNEWEVGHSNYQNGCNYGAKWLKEMILNQNK